MVVEDVIVVFDLLHYYENVVAFFSVGVPLLFNHRFFVVLVLLFRIMYLFNVHFHNADDDVQQQIVLVVSSG